MLYSHLVSAYRHFARRKTISFIMIAGLAISMAAAFLIVQQIRFETSFDRFHENADRIFRVVHGRYENNQLLYQRAQSFIPTGEAMKNEFESVKDFTTLFKISDQTEIVISHKENKGASLTTFNETEVFHAKGNFFNIFTVRVIEGSSTSSSIEPGTVYISATAAKKYFGSEAALNQILHHEYSGDFVVAGVFEDFPDNSHFHPDFLFGWTSVTDEASGGDGNNWRWDGFFTYILLTEGANPSSIEDSWSSFIEKYVPAIEGRESRFTLQPLLDIHLYSNFLGEAESNGDASNLHLLKALAGFIIVMAYINFINLSSASTIERRKGIAIRKIIGSNFSAIKAQFIIEGLMINLVAAVFAVFILLVLPFLLATDVKIIPTFMSQPLPWLILVTFALTTGAFVGLYLAYTSTSSTPVTLLKGRHPMGWKQGLTKKKMMLIAQFTISLIVITISLVVFKQLRFMQQQNLGIDLSQTIVMKTFAKFLPPGKDSVFQTKLTLLRDRLSEHSTIQGTAASYDIPGKEYLSLFSNFTSSSTDQNIAIYYSRIDSDFLRLFKVPLIAGINFSGDQTTDRGSVIINLQALKSIGIKNPVDAVGHELTLGSGVNASKFKIIGVVDFRSVSFKTENYPVLYQTSWAPLKFLSIKFNSQEDNLTSTLDYIRAQWKIVFPDQPFDYFLLDEFFDKQYEVDKRFAMILTSVAGVAIVVALMGLYGLASTVTLQRTREIGIRKVMGATVQNVAILLSLDFAIIVLIAGAISAPIAWKVTNALLVSYAFKTDLPLWLFMLPVLAMLVLVLLTIAQRVLKVSLTNPAIILKEE